MRLLRRFRWAGCSSGREWPLSPEGTARAEVLGVYHDSLKLLKDDAVLPSLQVRVVQASVQDTSMCILFSEESFSSRCGGGAWAAALGHRCWIRLRGGGGCALAAAAAGLRRSVAFIVQVWV